MKKAVFKSKGLIGIILGALLIIGCLQITGLKAAGRINPNTPITITAKIAENDQSIFAQEFDGKLQIRLYKIADIGETGKATVEAGFEDIDLSILDQNPSPEDIIDNIVAVAEPIAKDMEDYTTIEINRGDGKSEKTVTMPDGAGIYLYVPQPAADRRYTYTFTSYILYAPTSTYIMTGQGSDQWQYDVEFTIKSEAEQAYGDLAITKTLDTFNKSLGKASFVYKVTATLDNEVVLNNVYSIDFDKAGSKTRTIKDLPASAVVTVEEIYTGASYEAVGNEIVSGLVIKPGDTVTANFENDYNGNLISGGISAENQFTVDENGNIIWTDKDGNPKEQLHMEPAETFR